MRVNERKKLYKVSKTNSLRSLLFVVITKYNNETMVHLTGIEPARLSVLDPKSNASASSATGAYYIFLRLCIITNIL